MAASEAHTGHGRATLGEDTPGGGRILQSWTICACMLPRLRELLARPQLETYSTAEAVHRLGETVLGQPAPSRFSRGAGRDRTSRCLPGAETARTAGRTLSQRGRRSSSAARRGP